MINVGIDFSYSCPAVCVHSGEHFTLDKCKFFYLTDKRRCIIETEQFIGQLHKDFESQEQRIDFITTWIVNKIPKNSKVILEGYSYGSVRGGLCFNIGEITGVLKHKMYCKNIGYVPVPPTTVKKFACTSGRADKVQMYQQFIKDNENFDLLNTLHCVKIGSSPSSDIVDSYYLAKYGFENS